MLVHIGLDDSDELFKELDEFIMNADLKELEDERKVVVEGKEKDFEEEIKELIGEGMGVELLGIDIDKVTSDNLEDFLNVNADQANIQELEQRLERMNEWVENQPTGQITSYIQSNPTLSNNQDDQGWRYQTPNQRKEKVNAKDTRSGFGYGNEEEQNRNENENMKSAELGTTAQQYLSVLRRKRRSEAIFLFVAQSVASQSVPLRSSDPEQPRNDPKAYLEVENHLGDEPIVHNEDETPESTTILPTRAYESRKEMSLEMEPQELLGTGVECVVDTSSNDLGDITLDEFERMFDISEGPDLVNEIVVEGEKELEPGTEVEDESVRKHDDEPCEKLFFDEKPTIKGAEKNKYGGKEDVYLRQWKDGSIMRETKRWHDAWAKTRYELIVSNYEVLFDDLICRYIGGCNMLRSWHEERNRGKLRFRS